MRRSLWAALLLGFAIRLPGLFWGWNFPAGGVSHHVDEATHEILAETLIDPSIPPRYRPKPYPKGMAAHAAVPLLAVRAATGQARAALPASFQIVNVGRAAVVLYGTATIAIVFLLARRLSEDPRVATLAAWLFALGGLHVSQSHFFLADVPALSWSLVGTLLLYDDVRSGPAAGRARLAGAAFCFGVAFGVKLVIASIPSLALAALLRSPRVERAILAAAFALVGVVVVNAGSVTVYELYRALFNVSVPYEHSRLFSLLVYAIQLPSLAGSIVLLLSAGAVVPLARRLAGRSWTADRKAFVLCILVPQLITAVLVAFTLDNFLRHLLPFLPWIVIGAAWTLVRIMDASRTRVSPAWILTPVLLYQLAFVVDVERFFVLEPRNDAARWLHQNVPERTQVWWDGHRSLWNYRTDVVFPRDGRPDVLVFEMHRANEYLSAMGWKNSFPRDVRSVFSPGSQPLLDQLQAVFKGQSEYVEVARFDLTYVMPEYRLVEHLLGNRSSNYLASIVVFKKGEVRTRSGT